MNEQEDRYRISKKSLLFAVPPAIRQDESAAALEDAVAEVLAMRPEEIRNILIYSRIDELPESLLDILAYDYKVDWWDADYSVEEKRRTLKDSWYVHRILGTKAAVVRAISAIFPNTTVQEWFEYGGEPYHFRLTINTTDDEVDSEKQRRVLERLGFCKNLRSHNDGVRYFMEMEPAKAQALAGNTGEKLKMWTEVELKARPLTGKAETTAAFGVCGVHMRAEVIVGRERPE